MATTGSPTASPADDPIAATTGFATSTLTTARSVFGSRPTIRAGARVPSAKTASSRLPGTGRGRGDDVVVGEHVAVALDDDPEPGAGLLADPDLHRHDGGHGARGDVGHRARRSFLAPRDRGQPGTGLGEPRGAVRRQPTDEAARGADEQREHPRGPPAPAAAPGDRTGPRAGSAGRPHRAGGTPRRHPTRRRPEHGGTGRVAPRVVRTGPERRLLRRDIRTGVRWPLQRRTVPARTAEASASAAGGGAVRSIRRATRGRSRPRRRRTPRPGARRPRRTRHRPRVGRAGAGPSGERRRSIPRPTPGLRQAGRQPQRAAPRLAVRLAHQTQPAAAA